MKECTRYKKSAQQGDYEKLQKETLIQQNQTRIIVTKGLVIDAHKGDIKTCHLPNLVTRPLHLSKNYIVPVESRFPQNSNKNIALEKEGLGVPPQ